MEDLYKRINQEKDEFVFGLFEKYGYSKRKVMKMIQKQEIIMRMHGEDATYYVNGKALFKVHKTITFDKALCKATIKFEEVTPDEYMS